jgi:hypothetical protein
MTDRVIASSVPQSINNLFTRFNLLCGNVTHNTVRTAPEISYGPIREIIRMHRDRKKTVSA